jgi:Zn-dependent peptidase ImmA (M78 family)
MALAHELCHLLFDTADGRALGIASGRSAPILLEKIANAFAAEFLLPRAAIETSGIDYKTDDGFQELLDSFSVGATVAARQLANHGFISEPHGEYFIRKFGQTG